MKITDIEMPQTDFIYSAIHLIANRLQTLGDKIDSEVSTKQWLVLAAVSKFGETPPNIGDIASLLGTSRQNIKKISETLVQKGYLQLKKDSFDLRSTQLFLTGECHIYFKRREYQENEYLKKIFQNLNPDELTVLHDGLSKLIRNIDWMLENDNHAERER